jgi:hypothetical protein
MVRANGDGKWLQQMVSANGFGKWFRQMVSANGFGKPLQQKLKRDFTKKGKQDLIEVPSLFQVDVLVML